MFKMAAGSASLCIDLTNQIVKPRRIFAEESLPFNRIVYRLLGSTGFKVSEIGMGCMNMRDSELVRAALDLGINYFDTAWGYMNGENERVVGKVMKTERNRVFLTTKMPPKTSDEIMKMMETSLERLQTDHVDLVLLHGVDSKQQLFDENFKETFNKLREKGMTRYVGVSTHSNNAEVLDAAVESKFWEAVLVGYNYMSPENVRISIEKARKAGLAIIAMKNLFNPIDIKTWNWEMIKDIRKDKSTKITSTQALIKWVLEDPNIDITIPGITSFEQLHENIAIMGMDIRFGERSSLHRYSGDINNLQCRGVSGCTGCMTQCPKGVRINELNRCLKYAYSYKNMNLARENYRALPRSLKIDICKDCTECIIKCVNGLNLNETITKARNLFG